MALTVITLTNSPRSLRGDLTKWMQEIQPGVYVANMNKKVREQLWLRVTQTVGNGSATISYQTNNEIGYDFEIYNSSTEKIDYDGIPLVAVPNHSKNQKNINYGFSNAAKNRKAKIYSSKKTEILKPYVVLDIETTGLNSDSDEIIEIAIIKEIEGTQYFFEKLIQTSKLLTTDISNLTGLTNQKLNSEGYPLEEVLSEAVQFIGDLPVVGYNIKFDLSIINRKLQSLGKQPLNNLSIDMMQMVKKDKQFLRSYTLDEVLKSYQISFDTRHRAMIDAELTYELTKKVNKFANKFKV